MSHMYDFMLWAQKTCIEERPVHTQHATNSSLRFALAAITSRCDKTRAAVFILSTVC